MEDILVLFCNENQANQMWLFETESESIGAESREPLGSPCCPLRAQSSVACLQLPRANLVIDMALWDVGQVPAG